MFSWDPGDTESVKRAQIHRQSLVRALVISFTVAVRKRRMQADLAGSSPSPKPSTGHSERSPPGSEGAHSPDGTSTGIGPRSRGCDWSSMQALMTVVDLKQMAVIGLSKHP